MFTYQVSKFLTLLLLFVTIIPNLTCAQGFRLLTATFKSKYLEHARAIYVYTPPNFKTSKIITSYPVLYFNDGQNMYDPERSVFGQTWDLEKTLNTLIKQKLIPPVIAVAIDNTPARVFEYTFSLGSDGQGGGAKLYMEFLTKELIPHIEKNFPVSNDRALVGSSLGGLLALYGAITYPKSFSKIAAISPSIWWDQRKILNLLFKSPQLPSIIYADSGTRGGERPQDIGELDKVMNQRFKNKVIYKSMIFPGASHDEASWAKRLPIILEFLYSK